MSPVGSVGAQSAARGTSAICRPSVCRRSKAGLVDRDESREPRRPRQDLSSRVPERRKGHDPGCWTPCRILYLALGLKEELGAIELIGCH